MSVAEVVSIGQYAFFMLLVAVPAAGVLGVLIGTVLGFSLGNNEEGNQRNRRWKNTDSNKGKRNREMD